MIKATDIKACVLISVYLFSVSKIAAGTMLKFAAIGVKSVPQYPQVIPSAPTTAGFPPCIITKGTPTPMVMTVKAANAFPIIIVKITIPRQYAITPRMGTPCGTIPLANWPMILPIPAVANIAPKTPSNCGSKLEEPTCISIFEVSLTVFFNVGFANTTAKINAIIDAAPTT